MENNFVLEGIKPALSVEVSLLAARNANIDWVQEPRRNEALSAIVDCCSSFFAEEINWRVDSVKQHSFSHDSMTVIMKVTAVQSDQLQAIFNRDLCAMERSLESSLQSLFGWRQAAASAQIEAKLV